ncbi:MAG: hypothetical protein GX022_09085 [Clostridiaceae bacterium]|nr:hypothetical protein [Clostridiaceae bacterium]
MYKQQKHECRVKPVFSYMRESCRFFDLDNPFVDKVIFVLILAVIFGGYLFAKPYIESAFLYYEQINVNLLEQLDFSAIDMDTARKFFESMLNVTAIYTVIKAVAYILATYYGVFYYYSLTEPDTSWKKRTVIFLKKLIKIIIFNILFYGIFALGILFIFVLTVLISLFIPVIILVLPLLPITVLAVDILFIFKNLLIIEFDTGIFKTFKVALDITRECKKRVIFNGLFPHFLGLLLNSLAIDVKHPNLALFIIAFCEAMILLIFQRLTALMFIDAASIERKDKVPEKI